MEFLAGLFPWITNGPLILVQVMSGLSVGMFLFLVSVGMSLIFGVTRIVNLAHGSFYMVGATRSAIQNAHARSGRISTSVTIR